MNKDELNEYVYHYFSEGKNSGAIMLSGEWGIGKSYYIQNDLIPFLDKKCAKKKEKKQRAIIVSLYGVSSLQELSKQIYLAVRFNKPEFFKKEWFRAFALAGGTIAKSVAGLFNIGIDVSDDKLQEVFESIDLSGILLIIEDLERATVDTTELLGFVSSLIEEDHAKVLLVANEKELIKVKAQAKSEDDGKMQDSEKQTKEYDEKTQKYLIIKEKTVAETIRFSLDAKSALQNVACSFHLKRTFGPLLVPSRESDLEGLMEKLSHRNIRTVICVFQRFSDLMEILKKEKIDLPLEIENECFYSIASLTFREKTGSILSWDKDDGVISNDPFFSEHSNYRFCYRFITDHVIDPSSVKIEVEEIKLANEMNKSLASDPDIAVLVSFDLYEDTKVIKAFQNVEKRLESDDVKHGYYGVIISYSIFLGSLLGLPTEKMKAAIIKNAKESSKPFDPSYMFSNTIEQDNEQDRACFDTFRQEFIKILEEKNEKSKVLELNSDLDNIQVFCAYVTDERDYFFEKKTFAGVLDVKKLLSILKTIKPSDVYRLRLAFDYMYSFSNVFEFFKDDIPSLKELNSGMTDELIGSNPNKTAQRQIRWLKNGIEKIITRLESRQ